MVFVGPPGTGKSLSAKAVASEFGVPLLRFDFGRVFNSLVGSSEQRMRQALKAVESMSPCVLFCDEIDKGLAGLGGSGDSGTSQRVFGTFLTWLQENKAPVFTMITANNIWQMPPEMMRRGRFDAIFASSLPNDQERIDILKIHLDKVGKLDILPSTKRTQRTALAGFLAASNGYVGSEIESAVQDGLIEAFYKEETFTIDHVTDALREMVPLSTSYKIPIVAMVMWAQQNATPAGLKKVSHDFNLSEEEQSNVRKLTVGRFNSEEK
jgi:SpoVK/Ycf46/Vps4 family AAA+-type ATPase